MKRQATPATVIWFSALALMCGGLVGLVTGTANAADLIDTSSLGARGAILETPGDGSFALPDAQGLGDFNGDGLDDIAVAARETEFFAGDPLAVFLVYGRPGLTAATDPASRELLLVPPTIPAS